MIDSLYLCNISGQLEKSQDFAEIDCFIMRTCQRTLLLQYGSNPINVEKSPYTTHLQGVEAYIYLLEIICGLQSKLMGENEIVGQFKDAYKQYVALAHRDTRLQRLIEKLFKDSKHIRSHYLVGIGQKTYSAIARKQLINPFKPEKVLITGSGQLAEDLINQLKKKTIVYLCARNQKRVQELAATHGVEIYPWEKRHDIHEFAFIANSIGCQRKIWGDDFFQRWKQKHSERKFVDLGSPSTIQTLLKTQDGVLRLDDIFELGAIKEEKQKQQMAMAREELESLAKRRYKLLKQNSIQRVSSPKYYYA